MPWRVSRLMAAWLIRGASTCWAQPCSSATRPRRSPVAAKTLPPAGPGAGRRFGASASMALIRRIRPGVAAAFGAGSITNPTQVNPFFTQPTGYTGTSTTQAIKWDADALLGPGASSTNGADTMYADAHLEYRLGGWTFDLLTLAGRDDSQFGGVGTLNGSVATLALNGTTNAVLSQIESTGCTIDVALDAARVRGLAEADASADLDGDDARAKLAIEQLPQPHQPAQTSGIGGDRSEPGQADARARDAVGRRQGGVGGLMDQRGEVDPP